MVKKNTPHWISDSFNVVKTARGTSFEIEGIPLEKIAAKVAPPFFVYAAPDIKRRYHALENALKPHKIKIYYSLKPNTSLAVVGGLNKMGAGLEVASIGELVVAREVGAEPGHVSFAGPVKTHEELEFAIEWGIGTINGESEREFERISEIAGQKGKTQKVGFRVNPEKVVEGAGGLMGGGSQKFGFDVEKLKPEFIRKIQALPNIDLAGIHVFAATQMLNVEAFLNNLRNVCTVAQHLNESFPVRYVDFGGGLGIPYSVDQPVLPLDRISQTIGETLQEYPFLGENKVDLYVEPGRFLTGPSGIYVVRVDHTKESRGIEYAMIDGGWHHMSRTSPRMPFGQHPIYNLSRAGKTSDMSVGGSLCTSIDYLGEDVPLPSETQEGDLIGVFNAGAYGRTQSPTDFLSHPTAAEVLVGNGSFSVIRPSIHPREKLKEQVAPKKNHF